MQTSSAVIYQRDVPTNTLIHSWWLEQRSRLSMDAKDVRIFCQMAFKYTDYTAFSERRISPSEIGRRLGIPERTVRLRVKKMENDGFIKYYQAIPNFQIFGLRLAMYGFEASDIQSKHEIITKLRNRSGIVELIDFLGPIFAPTLAASSQEAIENESMKIKEESGLKTAFKLSESVTPPPAIVANKLDWQIILQLRYNALMSSKDIARSIGGITRRMVEYRISKLLDSRAFFVKAMIDVRNQQGIVFYTFTLFTDPVLKTKIADQLKALHGEKLWTMYAPTDSVFIVNLFAFTAGEPEESFLKTLKLPGVKSGTVSILREWLDPESPSWIDRLIEEQISA